MKHGQGNRKVDNPYLFVDGYKDKGIRRGERCKTFSYYTRFNFSQNHV